MIRNLLYTFVLLVVANLAVAQIEISPNEFVVQAEGQEQVEFRFDVINNGSDDVGLYWRLEPAEDFPENYKAQVCDLNLCYAWGGYQSSTSAAAANLVAAGSSGTFSIKVKHVDDNGTLDVNTFVVLKLYDSSDFSNEVASSGMPTVATNDLDVSDLVIFPNPTTDIFQLKNDESISKISLFNIVGREVVTMDHVRGQAHDVSTLRPGMYLVRIQNKDGDVVKSMRLSKR